MIACGCGIKLSKSFVHFGFSDGTAVDPESGLEDVAHVYCEGKNKFFAILCNVDIAKDKNSYYKIQLLESDDHRR